MFLDSSNVKYSDLLAFTLKGYSEFLPLTHKDNSGNIRDGMVTKLSVVSSFDKVEISPKKKARVDSDATETNFQLYS